MIRKSLAILGVLCASAAMAEPPPVLQFAGARTRGEVPPLHMKANLSGPRLTPEQMVRQVPLREDMGSGGDAVDLFAIQVLYGDAVKGNSVDIFWTENDENPNGVDVFADGALLGNRPGLPAAQLPGTNGANISKVPAGARTFKVEAEGTMSETTLTVLDLKPFSEPAGLQCKSSGFVSPDTGACAIDVTWTQADPEPEFYAVFLDGIFQDSWIGGRRSVLLLEVTPGPHEVVLRGFKNEHANGLYGGELHITTCDIDCEDLPCNPVSPLDICQIGYGSEPPGNQLQVEWLNSEVSYAGGLNVYIDDKLQGTTGPQTELATILNVMAGERKVGIEGNCGPDGKAQAVNTSFTVLAETPHPNPITGMPSCTFNATTAEIEVSWTLADPSLAIFVYGTRGQNQPQFLGSIGGSATGVIITGSEETDIIGLVFIKFMNGACYGSNVYTCSPASGGNQYIQGVCNGEGAAPAITSAIFGLNWLFLGGPTPPCQKACDADGSGDVNITDMVYVLNFLFLGGLPPSLWGGPNPICSTAGPEDNCEIPNSACPLP